MTPNPLCGVYRQFQLENMEGYMAALGAGMMSRNMVLRSQVTLRITEVGTSSRVGTQDRVVESTYQRLLCHCEIFLNLRLTSNLRLHL